MTLKTLHITNAWHATSGGIATFYRALMRGAEARGHYMRLIVPGEAPRTEEVGAYGRIYHVPAPRAPFNSTYRILYPNRYLAATSAVRSILLEERPDVVEICDKYTLHYLGGLLRIGWLAKNDFHPTVIGLSCERMDANLAAYLHRGKLGQWFARQYMKWLYFPQFDHHIANSEYTAGELGAASRGHKVRRGVWLGPMGVDITAFSPARRSEEKRRELRQRCGIQDSDILLLYAGRLAPEKNLPLLLDMLSHLEGAPQYRLLIAGHGKSQNGFQADAMRRAPGRVHFLGHLADRETLSDLYSNADIFIHPNPREPFGIAPLEAMASGLALVAPKSGGVVTYANDENAWLAEATGPSFAQAVREVHTDDALRQRKLQSARATAEWHRWERVTQIFLNLYEDLHAFTKGLKPELAIPALFFSTPGDFLGRELPDGMQARLVE